MIDRQEKRISELNYLILQIGLVSEKLNAYKMLLGKKELDDYLLYEHVKSLKKLDKLFESKLITILPNQNIEPLLYKISNDLYFIDTNQNIFESKKVFNRNISSNLDTLEVNLNKLKKEFQNLIKILNEELIKIKDEENYKS
jgi:hypothetical protein